MNRIDTPLHSLRFALRNGELVGIMEVARGLACGCVCARCHTPLVAKKGKKRVQHFAHHKGYESVECCETALHLLAKRILQDHKRLIVPDPRTGNPIPVSAESVEVEAHRDKLRPDVVFHVLDRVGNLRPLFIEITVFHPVGEEKLEFLKQSKQPTLEIRLGRLLDFERREQVESAVLEEMGNRRWLFNDKLPQVNQTRSQPRASGAIGHESPKQSPSYDHAPPSDFPSTTAVPSTETPKSWDIVPVPRLKGSLNKDQEVLAERIKKRNQRPVCCTTPDPGDNARMLHWVGNCPLNRITDLPGAAAPLQATCIEIECDRCAGYDGFTPGNTKIICFGKQQVPDYYNFFRNRK